MAMYCQADTLSDHIYTRPNLQAISLCVSLDVALICDNGINTNSMYELCARFNSSLSIAFFFFISLSIFLLPIAINNANGPCASVCGVHDHLISRILNSWSNCFEVRLYPQSG